VAVLGGSMTASTTTQLRQSGGGGRKGLIHRGGGDPFIAAGGGWQWWRELWSGTVAALNQWAQQSGIGHDLKAVSAGRRHCSDRVADDWGPRGFVFSQNYPNRIKVEN
jgi:hypothetical protein